MPILRRSDKKAAHPFCAPDCFPVPFPDFIPRKKARVVLWSLCAFHSSPRRLRTRSPGSGASSSSSSRSTRRVDGKTGGPSRSDRPRSKFCFTWHGDIPVRSHASISRHVAADQAAGGPPADDHTAAGRSSPRVRSRAGRDAPGIDSEKYHDCPLLL